MKTKKVFDAMGPIHQDGVFEINMPLGEGKTYGNIGIQLAPDGRIWICLDGQALFRFKPMRTKKEER